LLYVRDLTVLVQEFLRPLKESEDILPFTDTYAIFSNIEAILKFNEELYKGLKKHFATSQLNSKTDKSKAGEAQLGSAFLHMADFLKMYHQYCINHNSSIETHVSCRRKNSSYDKFITQTEASDRCGGLTLKDFLIKPIQRICKYPLLFRELLDSTPSVHPDYPFVTKTFQKVVEVTDHVNKITKQNELVMKLNTFDETVQGYPERMIDSMDRRSYVKDEILTQLIVDSNWKVKEEAKRHIYLFNDIIVLTRPQKRKKNYISKQLLYPPI